MPDPVITTSPQSEQIASTSGLQISASGSHHRRDSGEISDESDDGTPQMSDSAFIARNSRSRRRPSRRRPRGRVRSARDRRSRSLEEDPWQQTSAFVCLEYSFSFLFFCSLGRSFIQFMHFYGH